MLTGKGVLNFFPAGAGGLFVAGPYLTALQALPLGGRRTEGKLLVAHSDYPDLTLALVKNFVEDNRRLLGLAMANALPQSDGLHTELARERGSWDPAKKRPKYPDAKSAFSLIASDLLDVLGQKRTILSPSTPVSLHVYWLSSSGQGPSLEIFSVPSNLIRFLSLAASAPTSGAWNRMVGRGWSLGAEAESQATKKTKDSPKPLLTGPGRSRNPALMDLFSVYQNGFADTRRANLFVRRHLLCEVRGRVQRVEESGWQLADLFLKEVLGMSPERIERIRKFADTLAEYIHRRNDKACFRAVTFARRPW
ncbi:MAG: hypothetical protein ACREMY_27505, partial [bacterium]